MCGRLWNVRVEANEYETYDESDDEDENDDNSTTNGDKTTTAR